MAGTIRPSGMSITRVGTLTFQVDWKISDDNYADGQQFRWQTNNAKSDKWNNVAIANNTTSKRFSLTVSNYYPTTKAKIKWITVQIRGKRHGNDWSAWSEAKFTLSAPPMPTLSAALDGVYDYVSKFTWTTNVTNSKGHYPFVNNEYQSVLVKASNVTDGSKLTCWNSNNAGWMTNNTVGANSSLTITENSGILADNSYTRWVRIRSRGPGAYTTKKDQTEGFSKWRYAKHVYAKPNAAKITDASSKVVSPGATNIAVAWTIKQSAARPIDSMTVEYAIDTPLADLECPGTATWNAGPVQKYKTGNEKSNFTAAASVQADECLWVHIKTTHDRLDNYSDAAPVTFGVLTDPDNLNVTTGAGFTATISAQNNSAVPDSHMAVLYRSTNVEAFCIGVITHTDPDQAITVQCPDWTDETVSFGVYAFQGDYHTITRADGVDEMVINANMESGTVWDNGALPQAPTNVTAEVTETSGEVMLRWNWSWSGADLAEITWSTNPNAWESTEEPSSYTITNLHTAKWRISGLSTGEVWYFKVRLGTQGTDSNTYGPWSQMVSADLSSAPNVPIMQLTDSVIPGDGSVTASWQYISTDGTQQAYAEICQASISGGVITYGSILANTQGESHVTISAEEVGWTIGNTYDMCVRVTSESDHVSGWSDPISVTIAEAVTCSITATSLNSITITDGDGNTRTVDALQSTPLTLTVSGADKGGTTTVVIERAETYIVDRPDESQFNGYEGETIAIFSQTGDDPITINDLIGTFDDGAQYRIIATVQDDYGQSAEDTLDFEVHWTHQAVVPSASVTVSDYEMIALLQPAKPVGWAAGDTCDIYRLSADKPQLIIQGADFDQDYIDPYPTIGDKGGYRFVFITADGDYITAGDQFAWIDVVGGLNTLGTIIDFGGRRVVLDYNMEISHSWEKDFTETTYLGGSVQGDWNLSIHRSTSISADIVVTDPETIDNLRRLAAYAGTCHVRTVDGSTFAADVEVSEKRTYSSTGKIAEFSLTIKQVDSPTFDGMLKSEWEEESS